jgi:hypothetical protein
MTDNTDDDEPTNDLPEPEEDEGSGSKGRGISGSDGISGIKDAFAPLETQFAAAVDNMLEPLRQLQQFSEAMQELYEETQRAVESTIDLEDPWDYDPESTTVNQEVEGLARASIRELINELEGINDPHLNAYRERIQIGYEAYIGKVPNKDNEWVDVQPRYHEAIFIFISLQDGLMYWLCEQDNSVSPDKEYPSRNEYYSETKKDTLQDTYDSSNSLVSNKKFEENLDAFYHHRNFIMHGNPKAHFDRKIAAASALFFILTFRQVLDEKETMM